MTAVVVNAVVVFTVAAAVSYSCSRLGLLTGWSAKLFVVACWRCMHVVGFFLSSLVLNALMLANHTDSSRCCLFIVVASTKDNLLS